MVLEKREKYNGAYIKVLIPIKDNRTHDFSSKDTIECKRIKYIFRDWYYYYLILNFNNFS